MLTAIGRPLPIDPYVLPRSEEPMPSKASVVARPKANAAALENQQKQLNSLVQSPAKTMDKWKRRGFSPSNEWSSLCFCSCVTVTSYVANCERQHTECAWG